MSPSAQWSCRGRGVRPSLEALEERALLDAGVSGLLSTLYSNASGILNTAGFIGRLIPDNPFGGIIDSGSTYLANLSDQLGLNPFNPNSSPFIQSLAPAANSAANFSLTDFLVNGADQLGLNPFNPNSSPFIQSFAPNLDAALNALTPITSSGQAASEGFNLITSLIPGANNVLNTANQLADQFPTPFPNLVNSLSDAGVNFLNQYNLNPYSPTFQSLPDSLSTIGVNLLNQYNLNPYTPTINLNPIPPGPGSGGGLNINPDQLLPGIDFGGGSTPLTGIDTSGFDLSGLDLSGLGGSDLSGLDPNFFDNVA